MNKLNDPADNEAVTPRRRYLGKWISEQIEMFEMFEIDRTVLADAVGVPIEVVGAWEAGEVGLTLDQAMELDEQFMLPAGSTGAAGGYFSFLATPDLEGEDVFDSREYVDKDAMLADLHAAVDLEIGVRLSNRWEPIEVDHDEQSCVSEQRWVLDLLTNAPAVDPFH